METYGSNRPHLVARTAWAGLTWPEFHACCESLNAYIAYEYVIELYALWEKGLTAEQAIADCRGIAEQYEEG